MLRGFLKHEDDEKDRLIESLEKRAGRAEAEIEVWEEKWRNGEALRTGTNNLLCAIAYGYIETIARWAIADPTLMAVRSAALKVGGRPTQPVSLLQILEEKVDGYPIRREGLARWVDAGALLHYPAVDGSKGEDGFDRWGLRHETPPIDGLSHREVPPGLDDCPYLLKAMGKEA